MITVTVRVQTTIEQAWEIWNGPQHIIKWCSGHPDWHTTKCTNDLREGGHISTRMEAKDGSTGFEWSNTYDTVIPQTLIKYHMEDGRKCIITFKEQDREVVVTQKFDPETQNSIEQQQEGWQTIMDNYKLYVENRQEAT